MASFKVLIVDDEEEFVETIVKRLNDRGLKATGATSGQQALDLTQTQDFDVVILDVKMPGMDGIETLREMRKRKTLSEVIMLTGHGSVELGIQGLQLGAYTYVMKPVPLDELLEQMNEAYERKLIEEDKKLTAAAQEASDNRLRTIRKRQT